MELYKRYRPKTLKAVVGQPEAVSVVGGFLRQGNTPHALLFTGPSGCGKTSIARIMRMRLNCGDRDYREINCADFRGIDTVRDIRSRMWLSPIQGTSRVWVIDEAHKLSNDAQNAFLKLLEDPPSWVYFMLATTDTSKLIPTIKTRCTEIKLGTIHATHICKLVQHVADEEGAEVTEELVERIADIANGSARKALVLLEQVMHLEDEQDRLEALMRSDEKLQAIEIARALFAFKPRWGDVAKVLQNVEEEPEKIRALILEYATSILLKGGKLAGRAYLVVNAFRDHFFDSRRAGLVAACYEVVHAK